MKYVVDKELIAKVYKENRTNVKEVLNVQVKGKTKNVFIITFTDKDDLQHTDGYVSSSQSLYVEDFFFECKRWSLKKGYFIYSTNELAIIKSLCLENVCSFSTGNDNEIQMVITSADYIRKELLK